MTCAGDLDAAIYGEEDDFEDELDIDEMTYEVRALNCCVASGITAAAHDCAGCTSMQAATGCVVVPLPFCNTAVGAALC